MATPLNLWNLALPAAVIVAGLALAAVVLALLHRRRTRLDKPERACGRCGYDVRGLPTFICPECGCDLREVGIVSGAAPHPLPLLAHAIGSSWKRLALATVAFFALLAGGTWLLAAFALPHEVYPAGEVVLEPASKAYRVSLAMGSKMTTVDGWRGARDLKVREGKLAVNLASPGQVFDYNTDLRIDLDTWSSTLYRWQAGRSEVHKPVNFGRDQLEELFREKQIPLDRPESRQELDALMRLIDASRTQFIHRIAQGQPPFAVISSADKSTVQFGGREPLGPILISLGGGLWVLLMTGMVLTRAWRLRDGIPSRGLGRDAAPSQPALPRTLTVLFSDIKDFTARSAAADRTAAADLARRHRETAAPILRARRGTLVKTLGDGLLVTFESATDAVLAGLEIQSAAGDLELRIAIASGEVIVEAADVYGPTVNLASRLQSIARPGQVVLSPATRALVNQREVHLAPAGEHRLAGFDAPVEAFAATRPGR